MSWICKRCETENPDIVEVCEVCDANAPRIISFSYNKALFGAPITISWDSEYCDSTIISYAGNQIDVSKEKSYVIENPTETEIAFLLSNEDTTTRTVCFNFEILKIPTIDFISDKSKLKKGKGEKVNLSWNIENALSAKLLDTSGYIDISLNGEKQVEPDVNTIYKIEVVALDEKTIFEKELIISVFEECSIEFYADKRYVFPTIPVLLSWCVTNANKIWLDSEEVEAVGSKVVELKKARNYVLSAEDEFGINEKSIEIQMLPLPFIKTLMAPTPNFVSNMAVTIQQPRYNVGVKFPTIDIDWIKVEVPKVKTLTELGLNVELSPPLPNVNLMSLIKKMFKHIIVK